MEYIFDALLLLVAAWITYWLVPYMRANTAATTQANISAAVSIAVAAAQQIFESNQGSEKLAYAVAYLENLGIQVTTEEIEAAVYWLKNTVTVGLDGEIDE